MLILVAEGGQYHEPMELEPPQSLSILDLLRTEETLSDLPLFGEKKEDIASLIEQARISIDSLTLGGGEAASSLPKAVAEASSIADKLTALREYYIPSLSTEYDLAVIQAAEPPSQRELHEKLLSGLVHLGSESTQARAIVDHVMLFRAKEKYLFDFSLNQTIVADDPWLREAWAWVAGRCTRLSE